MRCIGGAAGRTAAWRRPLAIAGSGRRLAATPGVILVRTRLPIRHFRATAEQSGARRTETLVVVGEAHSEGYGWPRRRLARQPALGSARAKVLCLAHPALAKLDERSEGKRWRCSVHPDRGCWQLNRRVGCVWYASKSNKRR